MPRQPTQETRPEATKVQAIDMKLKQRQKIIGVVTLLAFLSFFLPTYFAHALFGLPDATDIITYSGQVVFGIIGNLTVIAAKALNTAVFVRPGGNILIVATTWTILRDFANMFFIILLIYMAFATIFDLGKYTFKDMIVRFVIVAVLINFSLVIGNLVVDFSQVLSNIFLGSIGNIGDRLGSFLNPSLLLPSKDIAAGPSLISLVFAIILSLIFLFNILVALVFAIIRTPIIWALLIVSPLAWMSHILPSSEGWWSKWWHQFLGWNLFLPVYLFFMYLGLLFLSKQQEIMNAVIQANTTAGNPATDPLLATLSNSLSFNTIFFYLFSAFVMLGGIWAATKTTSLFGAGFDKGLGWAKGLVKRAPLPYIGNLQAAETAYNARKSQFQQEGFQNKYLNKVYGGTDAQARADAKAGRVFGVRGGGYKAEKAFMDANKKLYDDLVEKYDLGKINVSEIRSNVVKYKATDPRGYASRRLLAKIGQLDRDTFTSTLEELKNNPLAAQEFAKTAKDSKFSNVGGDLLRIATSETGVDTSNPAAPRRFDYNKLKGIGNYLPAKREILRHIQTDIPTISGMSATQLNEAISIFGGSTTSEAKEFMKAVGEVRPDLTIDYGIAHPISGAVVKTQAELWDGALNADAKKIASMPKDVWNHAEFKNALGRKITTTPPLGIPAYTPSQIKAKDKLRQRLEDQLLSAKDSANKQAVLRLIP